MPCLLPPHALRNRGGRGITGGGQSGLPGPWRWSGVRGKGEGRCAGVIPILTSGWGGAQRRADRSGRRRVEETAAVALWARKEAMAGERGCGEGEPRWVPFYRRFRSVGEAVAVRSAGKLRGRN